MLIPYKWINFISYYEVFKLIKDLPGSIAVVGCYIGNNLFYNVIFNFLEGYTEFINIYDNPKEIISKFYDIIIENVNKYLSQKISTTKFFASQVLTRNSAYLDAILSKTDSFDDFSLVMS